MDDIIILWVSVTSTIILFCLQVIFELGPVIRSRVQPNPFETQSQRSGCTWLSESLVRYWPADTQRVEIDKVVIKMPYEGYFGKLRVESQRGSQFLILSPRKPRMVTQLYTKRRRSFCNPRDTETVTLVLTALIVGLGGFIDRTSPCHCRFKFFCGS